jgi:hypothetical protein
MITLPRPTREVVPQPTREVVRRQAAQKKGSRQRRHTHYLKGHQWLWPVQ